MENEMPEEADKASQHSAVQERVLNTPELDKLRNASTPHNLQVTNLLEHINDDDLLRDRSTNRSAYDLSSDSYLKTTLDHTFQEKLEDTSAGF